MSKDAEKYDQRGVSASKSEIHDAIRHLDKGLFPNAFCKVLSDIAGNDADYVNIMHADTAGTKTSLAYIYWKETGDLSVWKGIVEDAIVMNIDDMGCVGAVDNIVLSSTIGRNKHLIPAAVIDVIINHAQAFCDKLAHYGVHIILAGGETADVGDIVRTIDVGYTTFCRLPRNKIINIDIQEGDYIVGFSSSGQAVYEDSYNGGMGSNGLTSARHDVFSSVYRNKYPESYSPETDIRYIYSGSRQLTEEINAGGMNTTLGKLVLSPTRTYLPLLKNIVADFQHELNGIIHCSGGGQTKVLKFLDKPLCILKDNLFDVPPLFQIIQHESESSLEEMYQVFNMGHRLEIYTPSADAAAEMIKKAAFLNIEARIVGRVVKGDQPSVKIVKDSHIIEYQ
jgi:phosphoribosylformylglycinamidine cyclo-ligase